MRELARSKGWEIAGEYVDAGYSARSDARPNFRAMIADAKKKAVDVVVVHKLDRFSRRREDAVTYKALLRQVGVNLVSVSEPMDPDAPASVILEGMMEVINEWYSVNLAHEVAKGRRQRAEQGLWNGDLPFGYVKGEDGVPAIVTEEADAIRQAFEMYAGGCRTFQQVATWLNQEGLRPRAKRRDRKERQYLWSKDSVKGMLRNPFYLGHTSYKGKLLPGRHQPIVTQDLFDRVQKMRKEHYKGPSTYSPRHRVYLLGGLLRCAHCGEKLWSQHLKDRDYYREESALRGIPCPNGKKYVRAEIIDDQVSGLVEGLTLPGSWRDLVVSLLNSSEEKEKGLREKKRLEEKLRRLQHQYREVEIGEDEYRQEKQITEAAIAAFQGTEEEQVIQVGDWVEGLVGAWSNATKEERRDMLRLMLEAVYVDMETASVTALKPKPAFLPLFKLEGTKAGDLELVLGDPEGIRTPDLHRDRVAC